MIDNMLSIDSKWRLSVLDGQEFPAEMKWQYINWVSFGPLKAKLLAEYGPTPGRNDRLDVKVPNYKPSTPTSACLQSFLKCAEAADRQTVRQGHGTDVFVWQYK
jgi:hypothetical protein